MGIDSWLQKLAFLSSLRIKTRIALLAVVPIAGLLILAATYFIGERSVGAEFAAVRANTKLAELSASVQTSALQLRRREKDFLLNTDQKLIELHRAETLEALKLLDAMQASTAAGGVRDQTGQLRELMTAYAGQFDKVVGLQQQLGFDNDSGLQGALRKAVLNVETRLDAFNYDTLTSVGSFNADELIVKMLMMRRHEKDFILWGDTKNLDLHAKERKEFDLLLKLSAVSDADQAEIVTLMDAYQRDFGAWAKVDIEMREQVSRLSKGFAEMEPVFVSIDTIAQQGRDRANAKLAAVQNRTNTVWIATSALLLVLVLIFTYMVARGISRPLERITSVTMQLAEGDLEVDIIDHRRKDEIGSLASALQVFKENGVEKNRLEYEKQDALSLEQEKLAEQAVVEENFRTKFDEVVQSAIAGDFTARVEVDGTEGVMRRISEGMNTLMATVDQGLSETVAVVSAMAQGDLSKKIEGDYQGNFATLKHDTNRMGDQMQSIIGQIATASKSVDGATGEIASGVTDLSTRTEHQASSLEETTASMEELTATVKQNADNAQEANEVAVTASNSATNGGQVVEEAVSAMSRIEDSSKKITEIVGLIQEIAFQTNLLALNAAVEAARAGDAGKGFAVVANEVRALAQRAGQASKDIKELISSSDDQVREGVELVNKAGASLQDIVGSVKKVADFVSEIAAASQEQSAGIDQVSRAINSMEEMTQQNGALVEETTAALQSAQTQVGDLREVVGFFKTGAEAPVLPRADLADEAPIDNPVHRQRAVVKQAVAGGGMAAAVAEAVEEDADWQEF